MIIAGIGSRETPVEHLMTLEACGRALATAGHRGRSGGASGADTAFECGFRAVRPDLLRSYGPGDVSDDMMRLAEFYHPAWDRCSDYAKRLHARNGAILLDVDLRTPVDAIVCWTKAGRVSGGTGQALRIAADPTYAIPVFNLALVPIAALYEWMWSNA